jgi:hypothetical protein
MIALLCFLLTLFASPFKSKTRLEAENAAIKCQVLVLRRKVRARIRLTNGDRLFFVQLYRWFPSTLKAIIIIRPPRPCTKPPETASATAAITIGCGPARPASALSHKQT